MRYCILLLLLISNTAWGQLGLYKPVPVTLGLTYELHSSILGEDRKLNVYLPPGYNQKDSIKYPVIYLLDGGLDEDFIHVSGLIQFNSQPWVARVPDCILVGITSADRRRDFTFPSTFNSDKVLCPTSGGSAKFIAFLEKELQPYVARTFKTNSSKTLIGESLGGLLASEVFLTRPELFNYYVIISPSIWWDDGSLLRKPTVVTANNPSQKTHVYIAVGKEGLAPGDHPHVMEVDAHLLQDKIESVKNPNINIYLDYLPDETHATIAHQALLNAFKTIYKPGK